MIITETFERQKLYAFAADLFRSKGVKSVLDIACGDGEGSTILSRIIPSVIGVDLSADLIGSAQHKFSQQGVVFKVGDARKTDFSDAHFEGVVSSHTLEHFGAEDQLLFLRELRRITKPGGSILIATPDKEVWRLQGIAGMQEDHIRELTRREAEALLREAGVSVSHIFGQELLKPGTLRLRRFFNLLKKLDIFKLRRLFSDNLIASVDEGTQPVKLTGEVLPLTPGDRASINVFVCRVQK